MNRKQLRWGGSELVASIVVPSWDHSGHFFPDRKSHSVKDLCDKEVPGSSVFTFCPSAVTARLSSN